MAIRKEDFVKALRNAVSSEFSDVPRNEDNIECEFSDKFNKKIFKLIKSQKKSYWGLVNTVSKRVAIICMGIIAMLCCIFSVESVRVSAIDTIENVIVKTKSIFQIAYENDIPLSEVDKEGNFEYTEFESEERENTKDETTSAITGETFKDQKTNIYNKMLNTIDYFNSVELSAEIRMTDVDMTVDYYTDIDGKAAYEATYDRGKLRFETFRSPESEFLTNVDHKLKTYNQNYMKAYSREDSPYIPLEERIQIHPETGDGVPGYHYRINTTNCAMASYTILPEGLTFSYLADFDHWKIADDNVNYLDRKCVKIVGTPKPYSGEKHNNDEFMMLVDEQTGILLKFEGYKNGVLTGYITATKCFIDQKPNVKRFNLNNYSSYTEVFR